MCVKFVTSDKPQYIFAGHFVYRREPVVLSGARTPRGEGASEQIPFLPDLQTAYRHDPMKFVTSLRIERAKELLKQNDCSVPLIAKEVGFKHFGNFVRQFKTITGLTLAVYRVAGIQNTMTTPRIFPRSRGATLSEERSHVNLERTHK